MSILDEHTRCACDVAYAAEGEAVPATHHLGNLSPFIAILAVALH